MTTAGASDSAGYSQAVWTVGKVVGASQRLEARLGDVPSITIHAVADSLRMNVTAPVVDERFVIGETATFGMVASNFRFLVPDSVRWTIDGRFTGVGPRPVVTIPSTGTHDVTVSALGSSKTIHIRAYPDLLALYAAAPSDSEIARVQREFNISYLDGATADLKWATYGYTFDWTSPTPSKLPVIARLDVLRHQQFSSPLPFTGGKTIYEWLRSLIARATVSLDCPLNHGGGGLIAFNRTGAIWQGLVVTRNTPPGSCGDPSFTIPIDYFGAVDLIAHETRHSEPGDPGHTTCPSGSVGDVKLEGGSGYAYSMLYDMWVYKYGVFDPLSVKSLAKQTVQGVLPLVICSKPTHSDPRVQALLTELFGNS